MLIDEPKVVTTDPIFNMLSRGKGNKRIERGCYEIGHFGGSSFMEGYEHYPVLNAGPYGVCDSLEQIKEHYPELEDPSRYFVVVLTEVRRDEQSEWGGWRWHKWGEYIGNHQITHEYLYYEKDIERVFCYHIYEKKHSVAQRWTPKKE